jgi:hypothetical protein
MPEKEKKTADMKEYQKNYRKEHPKTKEEQNTYMKKYIARAESITCPVCGGEFRNYSKYKHDKTIKHIKALVAIKDKEEREKKEKEEQEALEKAQADALKSTKKRTVKKKKKLILEEEEEEEKPKEKPTPAPRKKKEEPPKEESSSSSGSESESDKEEGMSLDDAKFPLQSKKIDSAEVAKYIEEHFAGSANPARSSATKTPRLNKNLSLWKKVAKELDGKTFKYLGENMAEIIKKSYDKPSSQADFTQMLKMVIVHFTKVPEPVLKRITELVRSLKTAHIDKQTELPENGVTYEELAEKENDEDTRVALLARLYSKDMVPLRIGDYMNSTTIKTSDKNFIDLKKGLFIRHIKKNQEEDTEDKFPLPKSLVEFIKKRGIKGELFPNMSVTEIDNLLKKTFPGKKANPHYFRSLYAVKVAPHLDEKRLKEVLKIMDHSIKTHAQYYKKDQKNPLMKLLLK